MAGNYLAEVLALVASGELAGIGPGDVAHVIIEHDPWCAHFRGGECNCKPVVKLGEVLLAPRQAKGKVE